MRALTTFVGVGLVLIAMLACPRPASALSAKHPFGIGLAFGDPAGLTGKVLLNRGNALQFNLGWRAPRYYYAYRVDRDFGPIASLDWVHHFKPFGPRNRKVWFRVHLGAGGGAGVVGNGCYRDMFGDRYCVDDGSFALFARMPVGFNVYLKAVRFEFFAEVAPGILATPAFRPTVMGAAGARYYF